MAGQGRTQATMPAGRVGRPHGLDGSFYVTAARPRLLSPGTSVRVGGRSAAVVRRAGTDPHPILRLQGGEDREQARALSGVELTVERDSAPELEEDEGWAHGMEGW